MDIINLLWRLFCSCVLKGEEAACISHLLLASNSPQTAHISGPMLSAGQKSRRSLAGSFPRGSPGCNPVSGRALVSSEAQVGKDLLPSSLGYWHNLVPWGCRAEVSPLLPTVSRGPLSAPIGCPVLPCHMALLQVVPRDGSSLLRSQQGRFSLPLACQGRVLHDI